MASQVLPEVPIPDIILYLPRDIRIRRFRPSDNTALSIHGTSQNVGAHLTDRMPQPYTPSHAASWIAHNLDPTNHVPSGLYNDITRTSSGPRIPANYVICVAEEPCGTIGLEFGDINSIYRRSASVGYWLGSRFWEQGIMSLVVPAFVVWVWKTFPVLLRLNGGVFAGNPASAKLLLKAGYKYEGTKQGSAVKNGVVRSEEMYGMVRPGSEEAVTDVRGECR
jgi:ribosomal-protein-alanine N-acetyltransferase